MAGQIPGPFDVARLHEVERAMVPPGTSPASREAVSAWVAGVPAPQGSKRPLGRRGGFGKAIMIEQSKRVAPWRQDVREAFLPLGFGERQTGQARLNTGPLVVKIVFVMPRTKAMRNRPSADFPMVQKPDVDKLCRAVLDALTSAGVYADDSQVVACYGFKRRAEPGEPTGAMIHVEPFVASTLPPEGVPVPMGTVVRHRVSCPASTRDVPCVCEAESVAGPLVEGITAEQAARGFERFSRLLGEADEA